MRLKPEKLNFSVKTLLKIAEGAETELLKL